jgi:hypothetical protein
MNPVWILNSSVRLPPVHPRPECFCFICRGVRLFFFWLLMMVSSYNRPASRVNQAARESARARQFGRVRRRCLAHDCSVVIVGHGTNCGRIDTVVAGPMTRLPRVTAVVSVVVVVCVTTVGGVEQAASNSRDPVAAARMKQDFVFMTMEFWGLELG